MPGTTAVELSKAVVGSVTIQPPQGIPSTWTTQVSPGKGYLVVGGGFTPFVRIDTPLDPTKAAVALGQSLLEQTGVPPNKVTDFALASSVPGKDTFAATTAANLLELGAPNPVHVDTLCTSGATAVSMVVRALVEREGDGVALVLGTDHQGAGEIVLDNQFRAILAEVTGRALPMEFGLSPHALVEGHPFGTRFAISKEEFLEAVAIFVERFGKLPECVHDRIVQSFLDPAIDQHMWDTAATVARGYECTTDQAARMALESHRRCTRAADLGVFEGVMVVPEGQEGRDENVLRHPRPNDLGKSPTAPGVTPRSSSAMGGGAAGVMIASDRVVAEKNLQPLARIVAYATAKGPAGVMGLGPIAATRSLLEATGLDINDIPMVQVNEAFACVVWAFMNEFYPEAAATGVYPEQVNPYGGAIAHGHVMGATFLRMMAQVGRHFELHPDQRYALVTLCGGGGQGAAMLFENPNWAPGNKQPAWINEKVGKLPEAEAALYALLRSHGYLPTDAIIEAIRRFLQSRRELGKLPLVTPALTQQDIDYVIERNGGMTLPVADLLNRAQMVRDLREVKAGSSPTNGQRLGVVGVGVMGHQIAFDYALAGYEVTMADMNLEVAARGRDRILDLLYEAVGKGIYTPEEAERILARLHLTASMADEIRGSYDRPFEMVVEAAKEDEGAKRKIFEALRAAKEASGTEVILATNSSSIEASKVGAEANFHYFNPVRAMRMIDGSISPAITREARSRIEACLRQVAYATRKSYYQAEREAPALLVASVFAATYFAADLLPPLEEELRGRGVGGEAARSQAMALLEVLYVEAIRGEPKSLSEVLSRPLDVSEKGELARSLRRGGMGLFRLVDSTGGPRPYVETADHVVPFYGKGYGVPPLLRDQLTQWESFGNQTRWYPEGLDAYRYDSLVRAQTTAAVQSLGSERVEEIRARFHCRFWASVTHLVGVMHDKHVVADDRPDVIANAVAQGLNWTVDPERWLRTQGKREEVVRLLREEGWEIPRWLSGAPENLADLPPVAAVLRENWQGDKGVAHVVINRPRYANAVNPEVIRDLSAVAEEVAKSDAEVVVLEGEGSNLVGGADISWFKARQDESLRLRRAGDEEGAIAALAEIYDAFAAHEIEAMKRLRQDNRLLVAVVQGKNVGGGVEMIAQADFVLVLERDEGRSFQGWMPEASLGIGIGYGAHVELTRKVGKAHALRILLTGAGAMFGAEEALATGFANHVVPHGEVDSFLRRLISSWRTNLAQPEETRLSKEAFINRWNATLREEREGRGVKPSAELLRRLQAEKELWSDPLAVSVMALGQVPPWLEGEEKALAIKGVEAIRRGSPEAIAMLKRMVEEGESFDLRGGLIRIFDTPNARAGIGGRPGYRWPYNRGFLRLVAGYADQKKREGRGERGSGQL